MTSTLKLSAVVPAHNEEGNIEPTLTELIRVLDAEHIPFEIIVVDDNSIDGTSRVVATLAAQRPEIRIVTRARLPGFGRALRAGIGAVSGDVVVIVMADRSDDPRDVVRCYRKIEEGYDCVFGSRFRTGSRVTFPGNRAAQLGCRARLLPPRRHPAAGPPHVRERRRVTTSQPDPGCNPSRT